MDIIIEEEIYKLGLKRLPFIKMEFEDHDTNALCRFLDKFSHRKISSVSFEAKQINKT